MIGLLNPGSLMLGLIAWILPVISLMRFDKHHPNRVIYSVFSMGACTISLCFQIFYQYHLVKIEDWAALMDTTSAVAFAASVMVTITILLNIINLIIYRTINVK